MIKGSCLCGKISYKISSPIGEITHCHCTTCRKAHGSAFSSVAAVSIDNFELISGKKLLKHYSSSPDKARYFCSNCGSHIYAHREGQSHYIFRLGTLDDDPQTRPSNHIWVSLKAPWYDLKTDCSLPKHEKWAEGR
ncbi:MAG: GFA family protein [Methylococcales bacterium]|nr:GFA family protein [Methylococcales bacterium]